MKFRWIFFVAGFLVPWQLAGAGESFEGRIFFSITHEPKHPRLTEEDLAAGYGRAVLIRFKDGHRRMDWLDGRGEWEIYRSDDNKMFFKLHREPAIQVIDASKEPRELASFEERDSDEVILGRQTRKVVVEYADGSQSVYWYDPEIYLDPAPYRKKQFAYYNRLMETMKSPWLKHKRITEISEITYTATSITPKKLESDLFAIPTDDVEFKEFSIE